MGKTEDAVSLDVNAPSVTMSERAVEGELVDPPVSVEFVCFASGTDQFLSIIGLPSGDRFGEEVLERQGDESLSAWFGFGNRQWSDHGVPRVTGGKVVGADNWSLFHVSSGTNHDPDNDLTGAKREELIVG